jgi:phage-related protein (TIGR01555 family)
VPKPLDIDDEGIEIAEELDGVLETLGADAAFWQALCYQRAYGGGAILIGADDGMKDLAKPLDEKRIKSVDWLNVLSGGWDGEVVAWSYYGDARKANYGKPETYMVRNLGVPIARIPAPGEPSLQPVLPPDGATVWWVHESRLLIFSGTTVSHRARVQVRGWGDSVYTRVDEVLQQYGQTWGGIANLMTDFSQAVLSIKGLAQSIAGNKGVVSSRALQMNISRSIARILLIDSEEEFKRDTVSLAGVADVLDKFALRLAAAADMPLSLLMGQVQGGLGDASAGDIRYFYDRVASWQRRRMLPQLRRLIKLIFLSKDGPTSGKEPERWSVKPRPLYQLSATEKATQYLTMAQGDQIYYTMGAASAEEVAAKRFGGSDYDAGPIALDLDGRAGMSESFGEADPSAPALPAPDAAAPSEAKIVITPSMQGGIVKVNEARAKMGLPNWEGPDGELSINEFMVKHSGVVAQAANAEKGVVGEPQSVEEQAAAKAEEAKARFGGGKPGGGAPPFGGKPKGEPGEPGAPPFGKGPPDAAAKGEKPVGESAATDAPPAPAKKPDET